MSALANEHTRQRASCLCHPHLPSLAYKSIATCLLQADKANLRARGMKLKLEGLQSSLDQHSRQALRAAVSLEKHSASFPAECHTDIANLLTQLKGSLSQLLVLSMGEGHEASPSRVMRPQQLETLPASHCYI